MAWCDPILGMLCLGKISWEPIALGLLLAIGYVVYKIFEKPKRQ